MHSSRRARLVSPNSAPPSRPEQDDRHSAAMTPYKGWGSEVSTVVHAICHMKLSLGFGCLQLAHGGKLPDSVVDFQAASNFCISTIILDLRNVVGITTFFFYFG